MKPVLLTIALCGCAASTCPSGTTPHERGVERWCEDVDGNWHGPYERRDASGAVVVRGRYRHGTKAGPWSVEPRRPPEDEVERYVQNPPPDAATYALPAGAEATVSADGVRTVTKNGVRIAEGRFLADIPVGVHRTWRKDGTLRSEVPHDSDGRPDGVGLVDGERVRWDRGERVATEDPTAGP